MRRAPRGPVSIRAMPASVIALPLASIHARGGIAVASASPTPRRVVLGHPDARSTTSAAETARRRGRR